MWNLKVLGLISCGDSFFLFFHARNKAEKNFVFYFSTKLKTFHLSLSISKKIILVSNIGKLGELCGTYEC